MNFQSEMPSDWMVTEGDEEVLQLICPDNLNCVKEEEVVVWVDPLDGTSEYTQGNTTVINYNINLFPA